MNDFKASIYISEKVDFAVFYFSFLESIPKNCIIGIENNCVTYIAGDWKFELFRMDRFISLFFYYKLELQFSLHGNLKNS